MSTFRFFGLLLVGLVLLVFVGLAAAGFSNFLDDFRVLEVHLLGAK